MDSKKPHRPDQLGSLDQWQRIIVAGRTIAKAYGTLITFGRNMNGPQWAIDQKMPMRIAIAMMRTMQTNAFGRNVRARASAFACMLA